jgi:hypothetical protein
MLEVLQFIFASFWHWAGTLVLLVVSLGAFGEKVGRARGRVSDGGDHA